MGLDNLSFANKPTDPAPKREHLPTPAFVKLLTYVMRYFTYDNAPATKQCVAYQLEGAFEGFWGKATEGWEWRHCIKIAANPKYGWNEALYYYSKQHQPLDEFAQQVLNDVIARIGEPFGVDFAARIPRKAVPAEPLAPAAEAAPAIAYATVNQKEEIIRLLNHPVITRQEKTKILLNINRLDEERGAATIDKLKQAIEDRGGK